ncbi:MAG: hypothetical protein K6C08_07925 [Oscillospiraceae bacterium]|nr:hypothetical protein [Oscillospiraceae bacterium]
MSQWQYNAAADVYWQVGIQYCTDPADLTYETLGIFVPGAYFDAVPNDDGTYTCTISESGMQNGYTAYTAPVLFPVNTPGHKAQSAPTDYQKNAGTYTEEGFVYVVAGCRGKDAGIPAGVTDLKAAIRFIRANLNVLPGNTERFVAYGHSGGGSQTAVLGASGDSALYTPYLEAIGAADSSDAVNAAMCWCPITGFDSADEGHEWSMGNTRSDLSDEMKAVSDALAAAYADYVNEIGFTDEDGNALTLEESETGIFQAGTYYEYVKRTIEESLEHFLSDTSFPFSESSGKNQTSEAFDSAQDYLNCLNADGEWVTYDESSGKITISSIYDFSLHMKKASKPVAAFDKLEKGGHELFNTGDGECTHFDAVLAEIVKGTEYEEEFAEDLSATDALGKTMEYRLRMFSPLSFLMKANEDYDTAQVADFWRIRSGISQSDTPLTTEINLALALNSCGKNVDFETVWGQGHTQAERTGSSGENFIAWIHEIYP